MPLVNTIDEKARDAILKMAEKLELYVSFNIAPGERAYVNDSPRKIRERWVDFSKPNIEQVSAKLDALCEALGYEFIERPQKLIARKKTK